MGNRCFICRKKYGKKFTFHHLDYKSDEKTYRDFKSSMKYNEYILPIIDENPDRFVLLCNKCHYGVTKLSRYKRDKLERMFLVTMMTD